MITTHNKKKSDSLKSKINIHQVPKHIAIIMDGNGRWARKKLFPRTAGHKEGVKRVREIIEAAGNLGVEYLTLYAFSTENWNRPKDEVDFLLKLLLEFLNKEVENLHKNNIRLCILGDVEAFNHQIQAEINDALDKTKNNNKLILNVALNYGGRREIQRAVHSIISDIEAGQISKSEITTDTIQNYLYTRGQPDPDLLIRTSGEQRLSNFLLYQVAYTEFWYSKLFWPDFTSEEFYKAILDYQARHRRYGRL